MRKIRFAQLGKFCIRAAMFWMTMAAAQLRIIVQHFPVHGRHILHLDRNLAMTVRTPVIHFFRLPRRGMAGITIPAYLGM